MITVTKTISQVEVNPVLSSEEHWMKTYWRPAMAWVYMAICIFDFLIMPSWTAKSNLKPSDAIDLTLRMPEKDRAIVLQVLSKESVWSPITLREGGFIHLAFAGILGVAAWTRGKEKEKILDLQAQPPMAAGHMSGINPGMTPINTTMNSNTGTTTIQTGIPIGPNGLSNSRLTI